MNGNGRRKRRDDSQFALLIAGGQTVREAAAKAGIGETTGHRWVSEREFQERVAYLRRQMFEAAAGRLANQLSVAAETLIELCGPGSPPAVRLGAARSIVEASVNLRNLIDIEARLAALEEAQQHR